jgi:hypothetical protein
MKEKYKAAFMIPVGANKVLGGNGWEFETTIRLSSWRKEYLIDSLKLKLYETQ